MNRALRRRHARTMPVLALLAALLLLAAWAVRRPIPTAPLPFAEAVP